MQDCQWQSRRSRWELPLARTGNSRCVTSLTLGAPASGRCSQSTRGPTKSPPRLPVARLLGRRPDCLRWACATQLVTQGATTVLGTCRVCDGSLFHTICTGDLKAQARQVGEKGDQGGADCSRPGRKNPTAAAGRVTVRVVTAHAARPTAGRGPRPLNIAAPIRCIQPQAEL